MFSYVSFECKSFPLCLKCSFNISLSLNIIFFLSIIIILLLCFSKIEIISKSIGEKPGNERKGSNYFVERELKYIYYENIHEINKRLQMYKWFDSWVMQTELMYVKLMKILPPYVSFSYTVQVYESGIYQRTTECLYITKEI